MEESQLQYDDNTRCRHRACKNPAQGQPGFWSLCCECEFKYRDYSINSHWTAELKKLCTYLVKHYVLAKDMGWPTEETETILKRLTSEIKLLEIEMERYRENPLYQIKVRLSPRGFKAGFNFKKFEMKIPEAENSDLD